MKRWIVFITVTLTALGSLGCSMCCGPNDYDYPNYGGKHERVDPRYGRLGSIFSDPNAGFYGESADSNLSAPSPPRGSSSDGFEDDGDSEQLRRELNDDLESIDPLDRPFGDGEREALPSPGEEGSSTASRRWKRPPLRRGHAWR